MRGGAQRRSSNCGRCGDGLFPHPVLLQKGGAGIQTTDGGCDLLVGLVAAEFVLVLKAKRSRLVGQLQPTGRAGRRGRAARGPGRGGSDRGARRPEVDELARPQPGRLGHHGGQQGVEGDVERHAQEDIGRALVELAGSACRRRRRTGTGSGRAAGPYRRRRPGSRRMTMWRRKLGMVCSSSITLAIWSITRPSGAAHERYWGP